jgi:hypothetical protein
MAGVIPANAHVGSVIVLSPQPCRGLFLRLLDRFKDVLVQPFAAVRHQMVWDYFVFYLA